MFVLRVLPLLRPWNWFIGISQILPYILGIVFLGEMWWSVFWYYTMCCALLISILRFFSFHLTYLALTLGYTWMRWFVRRNKGLHWLLLSLRCIQCGQINLELVDWGCILLLATCFLPFSPSRWFIRRWCRYALSLWQLLHLLSQYICLLGSWCKVSQVIQLLVIL